MRRKSTLASIALFLAVAVTACGDEVTVQVLQSPSGTDTLSPVEDLAVEFLPFDRDSLFEALSARADEPEPEIPDTLRTMIEEVNDRQQEWRNADDEWQTLRDELRQIRQRMNGVNEASQEYRDLYERFTNLEGRVNSLERSKEQAFDRFDDLQQRTLSFADSVRVLRDAWADEAFRNYGDVVDSIVESRGAEIRYDTTDADGTVTRTLPSGDWWIHTRVSGPYEELYWNVLVPAGEDTLRLTPDNAERRLRL